MIHARFSALAVASVVISLAPIRVAAQAPARAGSSSAKVTSAAQPAKWTPPRLPGGRPDFGGYWTSHTATPLERPDTFAGREFLTEDEFKDLEQRAARRSEERRVGKECRL